MFTARKRRMKNTPVLPQSICRCNAFAVTVLIGILRDLTNWFYNACGCAKDGEQERTQDGRAGLAAPAGRTPTKRPE